MVTGLNRDSPPKEVADAFRQAYEIGKEFERCIRSTPRPGRPRALAVELVLESFRTWTDCTDEQVEYAVGVLLRSGEVTIPGLRGKSRVSRGWAKTRRKAAGLQRPKAS